MTYNEVMPVEFCKPLTIARVVVLSTFAGLACTATAPSPEPQPTGASGSQPTQPTTPAPSPSPTPAGPSPWLADDGAYINIEGVGVWVIDDAGSRLHHASSEPIVDMLEIEGQLFVLTARGIDRIDGDGSATGIAPLSEDTRVMPFRFAAVSAREFWVHGVEALWHWTEGSWEQVPIPSDWGPNHVNGHAIAVDGDGELWLDWDQLRHRVDGRWVSAELPSNNDPVAPELVARPAHDSMMILTECTGETCELVHVRGDVRTREALDLQGCPEYAWLAVSDSARYAALGGWCGLIHLQFGVDYGGPGTRVRRFDRGPEGWIGHHLQSLAVDDGGRIWAGHAEGLTLIAADGEVHSYPIAQWSDRSGSFGELLIRGAGPKPPPLGPVQVGSLAGTLSDDGIALAQTKVEICSGFPGPTIVPGPKQSPCAGVEPSWTATTDDEGRFEFPSLPLAVYLITVETGQGWKLAAPRTMNLRAGQTEDLGELWLLPVP